MEVYSRKYKFSYQGDIYVIDKSNTETKSYNLISHRGYRINDVSQEEFDYMFYCSYNIGDSMLSSDINEFKSQFDKLLPTDKTDEENKDFEISEISIGELRFDAKFLDKYFPQNDNLLYNLFREELIIQYANIDKTTDVLHLLNNTRLKDYLLELHNTQLLKTLDEDTADLVAYALQIKYISDDNRASKFSVVIEGIKENNI
jgi:hypothetical protein